MEITLQLKLLKEKITQSDLSIKNLIKNISKCTDLQTFNALNTEIFTRLNNTRHYLLDYKTLIKNIIDYELKSEMEKEIEFIQNQFEINLVVVHNTIQDSQKRINNLNRAKLFEYTDKLRNRFDVSKNKSIIDSETKANKTTEVTDNLFLVTRMLAGEVDKSSKNLETLVSSSALATETSEELKTMSNYIANSKTLLSKYGRREMTDKILTMLAFGFFFGCVIYVVIKRL